MTNAGTHTGATPGDCPESLDGAGASARLRRHERTLRQGIARAEAQHANQAQLAPSDAGGSESADAPEPPALAILRAELAETERALRRVVDGAYGRCVDCGQPIALARLRVVPSAQRCDGCARTASTSSAATPRHMPTIHGEGYPGDERRLV